MDEFLLYVSYCLVALLEIDLFRKLNITSCNVAEHKCNCIPREILTSIFCQMSENWKVASSSTIPYCQTCLALL